MTCPYCNSELVKAGFYNEVEPATRKIGELHPPFIPLKITFIYKCQECLDIKIERYKYIKYYPNKKDCNETKSTDTKL